MARKKRIIILGGGIASLAAAYHLTSRENWQDQYDVTLYQMGWRLGGKCASGRNPEVASRIEEHGLHVWFGFYENAFATLRACYRDLNRPPGAPFSSMDQVFHGIDDISLMPDRGDTRWSILPVRMPVRSGTPGDGRSLPGGWDTVTTLIERLHENSANLPRPSEAEIEASPKPEQLESVLGDRDFDPEPLLAEALAVARGLAPQGETNSLAGREIILALLRRTKAVVGRLLLWFKDREPLVHHLRLIDVALVFAIGILADRLLERGLRSIDDEEFSDWMRRHGADRATVTFCAIRTLYDTFFAFTDGDTRRPSVAAGAALGCALKMGLIYKGHSVYEMNAGMGDVVIAPLYEVLRKRGVKFIFFHRVINLELNASRDAIARIHFAVQANLKHPDRGYEPLERPREPAIPFWRLKPDYEQLVEGPELQRGKIDLESHWTPWKDPGYDTLELAPDDRVVLGIALPALGIGRVGEPVMCGELCEANQSWRRLIDTVPSVQTQAMQLWMTRSHEQLGWPYRRPLTMVSAPEPLDVWADMSHLLPEETWPSPPPASLYYGCGPLEGDLLKTRLSSDAGVPREAYEDVLAQTRDWLNRYTRWIWPGAVDPANPNRFSWDLLHGGAEVGPDRLRNQFLRANIDPTERYVLSPPGGNLNRLESDGSGFRNLVLAGDWTVTSINAGCVEAAVMSGMAASRAICGYPQQIAGEDFMRGRRNEA